MRPLLPPDQECENGALFDIFIRDHLRLDVVKLASILASVRHVYSVGDTAVARMDIGKCSLSPLITRCRW